MRSLRILAGLLVGITIVLGAGAAAVGHAPSVPVSELQPTQKHRRATEAILQLMRRYHYRKVAVNDELSERFFDRYLKALDPNRSIFLASDIREFSKYRDRFDDALRYAELDIPFEIFKRFRERMETRAARAVELLETHFDYQKDESYQFDREGAAWKEAVAELDELWRKRVKNDALELRLAGRKPDEIRKTLRKRYERMGRRVDQLNVNDIFQFFVNAFTLSVEPHTSYFSPRAAENFDIRMRLSLQGIGAALQTENEYTVVRRIIAGGPAALSKKLHVNDRIVGVGQGSAGEILDVVSWRLEDVVDLIRGPKGTVVRLQISPGDNPPGVPPTTIALLRDKINLEERAAKSSVVEVPDRPSAMRIGVIDVPTFYLDSVGRAKGLPDYRSTTRDVRRVIESLRAQNVAGIVIDLRSNSGGSLVEATELTGLFIERGPVVQIRDSRGRLQIQEDADPEIAYAGPLAVLVDRRSASASEIFAGAIQDYRRGIIIGEPTFGKGTVQNLFDLGRHGGLGKLKVTIAQFFRVNGDGTQHRGVVPDIVFPTARDSKSHGERGLDNALPWAHVKPAHYRPFVSLDRAYARVRELHRQRASKDPRFALLIKELQLRRQRREDTTVSLVERVRRQEWEERKEARGQDLYRKSLGLGNDAAGQGDAADGEKKKEEAPDILLEEAAKILSDLIHQDQRQQPRVADSM